MSCGDVLEPIKATIEGLRLLMNRAYEQYAELVDSVLLGRITDEQTIEQIMDGLVDFGDDERFLDIYRKLCRHVYFHYPQLVGEHVTLFRLQFEDADKHVDFE